MKFSLVVLFAVFCVASAIHGGGNAFRNAYPFMVSIQHRFFPNYIHMCGGVILNNRWVLTSGDCTDTLSPIEIHAGRHDLQARETGQKQIISWGPSVISADGNLKLIRLAGDLEFGPTVTNITLAPNTGAVVGSLGTLVGWAFRSTISLERTQVLRQAQFRVMDPDMCQDLIAGTNMTYNENTEFCTTTPTGLLTGDVAACTGNLGSPFVFGETGKELGGILVRFSSPCNAAGRPTGIFANINAYRNWIEANVNQP